MKARRRYKNESVNFKLSIRMANFYLILIQLRCVQYVISRVILKAQFSVKLADKTSICKCNMNSIVVANTFAMVCMFCDTKSTTLFIHTCLNIYLHVFGVKHTSV